MSPPNLDNLLVVPSGCGEQNLVKTTNNFVVANYLDSTDQLTGPIAVRVRANILKGEGALKWRWESRHAFSQQSLCSMLGRKRLGILQSVFKGVHKTNANKCSIMPY